MNDPNKRIDVNLSSLLSLKAELLRKQQEVNKTKLKQSIETFVPKKSKNVEKKESNDNASKTNTSTNAKIYEEYEDSSVLEKSKKVLQAKAKFYDKMSVAGGSLNSDDNCLVMFNQKKQNNKTDERNSNYKSDSDGSDSNSEHQDENAQNSDEEWVEYTDCLGRTRKCLRKDLQFFKKKDNKLADNIQPREINQNAPLWMIDTAGSTTNLELKPPLEDDVSETGTSIMSKYDQMKINWEKKQEENLFKENVHYQDVLFDEARQHGVGYYAFSTDDEERAKQLKALDELRAKTLESQKQREKQRQQREKIIAERVRAAKNRQRARLGLPPLEDEPKSEDTSNKPLFKEDEKQKRREEKKRRRKEKEDQRKEEERKNHIRPWDKNKDVFGGELSKSEDSDSGSENEWKYKPEREPMTQEQWNEMQRNQRKPEFAPVSEPIRSFRAVPPPTQPLPVDEYMVEPNSFFFTSKKSEKPKEFVRKNYIAEHTEQTIPIRNQLGDDNDDDEPRVKKGRGAEIAPPPTFEYYGPSSTKKSKAPYKQNVEQSIEAGLKYLRNQSDKGILPTKSNWSSNADY